MQPQIIIQSQLEAYNARNLERFAALHADDIELFNFQDPTPYVKGKVQLKKVYNDVFQNSPHLKATVKNRIVFDNKVIDDEQVTGRKGLELVEVIAIYEVEYDLIRRVTFIRK